MAPEHDGAIFFTIGRLLSKKLIKYEESLFVLINNTSV